MVGGNDERHFASLWTLGEKTGQRFVGVRLLSITWNFCGTIIEAKNYLILVETPLTLGQTEATDSWMAAARNIDSRSRDSAGGRPYVKSSSRRGRGLDSIHIRFH
jgi:hypothetical protein